MATPQRELLVNIKPKQSRERDLVVKAVPNMLLRNRAHAYLARTVLGWGLSQKEANLFAGLHGLLKEKASITYKFTKPQHVDALLHDLTKGNVNPVIPEKAHEPVKENGNGLADYLEDIKKDGDSGYAQYLRDERLQIPYKLREMGTVYLGKFFKYGRQGLSDTEALAAKQYIEELKEKGATNHFKVVRPNDLLGALDGNRAATKRVQQAIQQAAQKTPLGRELAKTRRGQFTKKAIALLTAVGFAATTALGVVQYGKNLGYNQALQQFKQGKPAIEQPQGKTGQGQQAISRLYLERLAREKGWKAEKLTPPSRDNWQNLKPEQKYAYNKFMNQITEKDQTSRNGILYYAVELGFKPTETGGKQFDLLNKIAKEAFPGEYGLSSPEKNPKLAIADVLGVLMHPANVDEVNDVLKNGTNSKTYAKAIGIPNIDYSKIPNSQKATENFINAYAKMATKKVFIYLANHKGEFDHVLVWQLTRQKPKINYDPNIPIPVGLFNFDKM